MDPKLFVVNLFIIFCIYQTSALKNARSLKGSSSPELAVIETDDKNEPLATGIVLTSGYALASTRCFSRPSWSKNYRPDHYQPSYWYPPRCPPSCVCRNHQIYRCYRVRSGRRPRALMERKGDEVRSLRLLSLDQNEDDGLVLVETKHSFTLRSLADPATKIGRIINKIRQHRKNGDKYKLIGWQKNGDHLEKSSVDAEAVPLSECQIKEQHKHLMCLKTQTRSLGTLDAGAAVVDDQNPGLLSGVVIDIKDAYAIVKDAAYIYERIEGLLKHDVVEKLRNWRRKGRSGCSRLTNLKRTTVAVLMILCNIHLHYKFG